MRNRSFDLSELNPSLFGRLCPDCDEDGVGSYVEQRSRIFHEDIPLPGTGLSLHYASDRTPEYDHVINVPASGPEVNPEIKRIIAGVDVGGKVYEQTLPAAPRQSAEFVWDGLDFLGRPVKETVKADIRIGYVYDTEYIQAARGYFRMAFGQFGMEVTGVPCQRRGGHMD